MITTKKEAIEEIQAFFSDLDGFLREVSKEDIFFSLIYDVWKERKYTDLTSEDLSNIKELDLSLLAMKNLPSEFGYLDTLESLELCGNNFEELPDTLWWLHNLKELSLGSPGLGGNPITTLSPKIKNLKKLEFLDISDCSELISLPEELLELENLTYLRMSQYLLYKSKVVQTLQKEKHCNIVFEETLPPIRV